MSFILSAAVLAFALLWLACFLRQSGLNIGKGEAADSLKREFEGEKVSKRDILGVAALMLAFRLAVWIAGAAYMCIFSDGTSFGFGDFLESWKRWDAPNYIDIARKGYSGCVEDGKHLFLVFFPLYPWLVRAAHVVIRNWEAAAMAVSAVCFVVGACFFYALIAEEYKKSVAQKALVCLSVYPFAFFYGGMMSESLFFCTMSAGFYFIKKHNWPTAGVAGILCSLCRVQGILLLGVAGVEFFTFYKPFLMIKKKEGRLLVRHILTKGIFLLLMPVGNLIYFYINYRTEGNPFQFSVYQKQHWYHEPTYFTNALKEIAGYAFSDDTANTLAASIWLPELILFFVALILLFYGIRRHPLKYTAFLFVYTMINYSVTFLISGGRYMSCAFPMFIILGELFDRHPRAYQAAVATSSMLLAVYMAGFMSWKQIM